MISMTKLTQQETARLRDEETLAVVGRAKRSHRQFVLSQWTWLARKLITRALGSPSAYECTAYTDQDR